MLRDHIDSNQAASHDDSVLLFDLKPASSVVGYIRGLSPHRLRDAFSVHTVKLDDSGDAL